MIMDKHITVRYIKMEPNQGPYWEGDVIYVPIPPDYIEVVFDVEKFQSLME